VRIQRVSRASQTTFSRPRREFIADFSTWLGIGVWLALNYVFYFQSPLATGVKVVMGCACFGLFGGMLSYLTAERRNIVQLGETGGENAPNPAAMLSVSAKMLFFMVTVLLFMTLVVLLMVFMDINFLLANRDALGSNIYMGVFKEIVFAFLVLLGLSLSILTRYSGNMRLVLKNQLKAMERFAQGDYQAGVPVVSNDEFGVIAAKTNDMMEGLRERDMCRLSFAKYMTPEVSEKILKGEISQKGEMHQVSILFCDLRGYTPFVEKRRPEEVVEFLNAYFSEMAQSIKKNNGIVLQYIGDEIEAVFGYPIPEDDHGRMALRAALDMRHRLEKLNGDRKAAGKEPVRHGVGIHTGEVLAGSVGSPDRLVYAMVGDAVNVASRIQNLNKQFGTDILISAAAMALLPPDEFALEGLGPAAIRGKSKAVEIYKVS